VPEFGQNCFWHFVFLEQTRKQKLRTTLLRLSKGIKAFDYFLHGFVCKGS